MIKNNKKFLLISLCFVAIAGLAGLLLDLPIAQANFFTDLFKNITGQFFSGSSSSENLNLPAAKDSEILYKPAIDYEKAVVEAVKKVSPAVVSITISKNVPIIENCPFGPFSNLPPEFQDFFGNDFPQFNEPCEQGTRFQEIGNGTGFIVSSDGLILTNKHVVSDKNASYTVFTNDGKKYEAKVLARDPIQDLALISIAAKNLKTVELGDSDSIELGQTAIAIGNALGEFRNTVSVGVISGLARTVTASGGGTTETIQGVIQTDAAINPGNSGGPIINLKGEVIGINTAVASGAQSIGFAIPINRAKRDIESVKVSGEITVPFLGVRYILITEEVMKSQKLAVDYGALIRGNEDGPPVEPNSPAAEAGIKSEDIILEVNGKKITKDRGLGEIISEHKVGEVLVLTVLRDGKNITLKATLAKRPS